MDLPFGLTQVIAQGLRGRRVQFTLAGRTLTGLLTRIDLQPGRALGVALALGDVRFDGMPVADVSLRAAEVSLERPPRVGFALSGIELSGVAAIDELIAWADRNSPDWQLKRLDGNRVMAIERGGPRRVTAAPSLRGGALTLEIQRVAWGEIGIDVPLWLPLTHRVELPALPAGISILDAVRRGEAVAFRLAIRDVKRKLDLLGALTGGGGSQEFKPPATPEE